MKFKGKYVKKNNVRKAQLAQVKREKGENKRDFLQKTKGFFVNV